MGHRRGRELNRVAQRLSGTNGREEARMRRIATGLALVLTVLAACGRSQSLSPQDAGQGTPDVRAGWTSCATEVPEPNLGASADGLTLPRLGTDFVATAAIVCATQPERRPDGGEDLLQVESRADDVTALIAALRLPDQADTQRACTMELPVVPWLVLLDAAGRWVRPGLPKDECGKIRIEVRQAIGALKLTRITARTLSEIESSGAAASGCGQRWADMVSVETTSGRSLAQAATNPLAVAQRVRLCVYRVPADEQGSNKPAGTFERGGILTPARRDSIEKALVLTTPARACAAHAGRFALLRAVDGVGADIYIELDGCQRIMVTPNSGAPTLAQADAPLITALNQQ
jgi:hypothetical protein